MLLADIYHMLMENESLEEIEKARGILCHVHIAHPEGRQYPHAQDGMDYTRIKNVLTQTGYDLGISIEGRCTGDFVSEAENSLSFLKSLLI